MLGRLGWPLCAILLFAGVVWLSVEQPWKPLGYSGLEFAPMSPAASARTPLLSGGGALVLDVDENSPAARALIRPGEVVAVIDGTTIASAKHASDIIRRHKAGDRIALSLFDITQGEVHPHTARLTFDAAPPVTKKLTVRPPRTLAKELFYLPTMAANAAWSGRIARGPTIRPVALFGLGDGHCNGFAPEGWRTAGHARDDSMFHVMANEGFAHAVFQSAELGKQTPEDFVSAFLNRTFGAPAVMTPPQDLPSGFTVRDFGNSRGGAGFVEYRVTGGRIALWVAAAPAADASWARPLTGAVALSLHCAAPAAPPPLPRAPYLPMTAVSTACIDGQCREADFAGAYIKVLKFGYVHNRTGANFLVTPKRDYWVNGADGPGFYHQIGGENEKLEPGRTN
jgi:PDZ domain